MGVVRAREGGNEQCIAAILALVITVLWVLYVDYAHTHTQDSCI